MSAQLNEDVSVKGVISQEGKGTVLPVIWGLALYLFTHNNRHQRYGVLCRTMYAERPMLSISLPPSQHGPM